MHSKTFLEISGQFGALQQTERQVDRDSGAIRRFFCEKPFGRVIFTGSGSSYLVCKSLAASANLLLTTPAHAIPAGDLMLHLETYRPLLKDSLVFVLSRSGSTDELIHTMRGVEGLNCGARFFSVVCTNGSRVAGLSGLTVQLPWAFDESVCQTRSVTNMYAAALLVLGLVAGRGDISGDIAYIAAHGTQYLDDIGPEVSAIAGEPWDNVWVLADAEANGVAWECALAFGEIAYLPASCKHVLDVRHGPIVLIGQNSLVLALLDNDRFSYQAALVADLVKKGVRVVVCGPRSLPRLPGVRASFGFDRELCPSAAVFPLLAASQLLACLRAERDGLNPDQPAGLEPWIAL